MVGRIPQVMIKRTLAQVINRAKIKSIINDKGCWIYQGSITKDGYAIIGYNSKNEYLHRLGMHYYRQYDLNSNLIICHKDDLCNNKSCWNPEHLYIGTYSQNYSDLIRKYGHRNTKSICKRGHDLTVENNIRRRGHRIECKLCSNLMQNQRKANKK